MAESNANNFNDVQGNPGFRICLNILEDTFPYLRPSACEYWIIHSLVQKGVNGVLLQGTPLVVAVLANPHLKGLKFVDDATLIPRCCPNLMPNLVNASSRGMKLSGKKCKDSFTLAIFAAISSAILFFCG